MDPPPRVIVLFITSSDCDKGGLAVEKRGETLQSLDVAACFDHAVSQEVARRIKLSVNSTIVLLSDGQVTVHPESASSISQLSIR